MIIDETRLQTTLNGKETQNLLKRAVTVVSLPLFSIWIFLHCVSFVLGGGVQIKIILQHLGTMLQKRALKRFSGNLTFIFVDTLMIHEKADENTLISLLINFKD